jgi:hypothetical protein
MANSFSKAEITAFDKVLEGFDDGLVISKAFGKYDMPGQMAERAGNTIWRPQPYIAQSFTGLDQSSNFARNYTQLSVPTTINYSHSVPLTLSATELRDLLQSERLGKAAMQRLASDINVDCSNLAAVSGTVVIKRTTAASGFDDVAAMDTAMNRLGISMSDRKAFFSSTDYNAMASNLAGRQTLNGKTQTAYEKAFIGKSPASIRTSSTMPIASPQRPARPLPSMAPTSITRRLRPRSTLVASSTSTRTTATRRWRSLSAAARSRLATLSRSRASTRCITSPRRTPAR